MRLLGIALIVGLFAPLVILAQPFGDTELTVFDTDFMAAPEGPPPELPSEPPLPAWLAAAPAEPAATALPPIPVPELSS